MNGPDEISREELQLATRNHGMPLELLREPITPLGLHYLLTHYDVPRVDPAQWRLSIEGLVREPHALSLDDLRARESTTVAVTMECAGNGRALLSPRPVSQPWLVEAIGTAEWTGVPLGPLLEEAGVADDAIEILFSALDRGFEGGVEQHYERSLPLAEALRDEVLLAYAVNGEPLPPQHGFPLRLVVPGWYGMTNVKWLARISVLAEPFEGYQQRWAYRFRESEDEPGTPLTRMMPRALMAPPGIPDFMSRERFLAPGPCRLEGRAWSGWGSIERVEVSVDDGRTWADAELGEAPSPFAWRSWSYAWDAFGPGRRMLACRAADSAGNEQPDEPGWNLGGYANNAAHRMPVTVLA
jgi:sulfane dehydrogenase subunit SoxC